MDGPDVGGDPVDRALARVDHDMFAAEHGASLPQSSAPAAVAGVLRLLQVEPGMRVLEVGTGSGFSTALLCHLVGPRGRVVTVDVDPALAVRAAALLRAAGLHQAAAVAGDARALALPVPAERFDRLVAWTTADTLPGRWLRAVPDGWAAVPLRLAPLEGAAPVARIEVRGGTPAVRGFFDAGFVPMTAAPVVDFEALRRQRADLVLESGQSGASAPGRLYLSAPWLRAEGPGALRSTADALTDGPVPLRRPLQPGERADDLWWYLAGSAPDGLASAVLLPGGPAFGCGDRRGLVLVRRHSGVEGAEALGWGAPEAAARRLSGWIVSWREAGRPGLDALRGRCERAAHDAWRVKPWGARGGQAPRPTAPRRT